MNLTRRNNLPVSTFRPNAMEDQFGRLMESMFEDFFAPFTPYSSLSRWDSEGTTSPRLNVAETDKSFEVEAELPGVKKEDIKVAIDNQRVTIEGEVKRESAEKEGEHVVYAERTSRKFSRSFALPSEVDDANAQARLENGILTLSLPKKPGIGAKQITIQ